MQPDLNAKNLALLTKQEQAAASMPGVPSYSGTGARRKSRLSRDSNASYMTKNSHEEMPTIEEEAVRTLTQRIPTAC